MPAQNDAASIGVTARSAGANPARRGRAEALVEERERLRRAVVGDQVREEPPFGEAPGWRHPARVRGEAALEADARSSVREEQIDHALRGSIVGDEEPPSLVERGGGHGAPEGPGGRLAGGVEDEEPFVANGEEETIVGLGEESRWGRERQARQAVRVEEEELGGAGEEDERVADFVPFAERRSRDAQVDREGVGGGRAGPLRLGGEGARGLGPPRVRSGGVDRRGALGVAGSGRERAEDRDEGRRELPDGAEREVHRREEASERARVVIDERRAGEGRIELPLVRVGVLPVVIDGPEEGAAQAAAAPRVRRVRAQDLNFRREGGAVRAPDRVGVRARHRTRKRTPQATFADLEHERGPNLQIAPARSAAGVPA